MKHFLSYTKAAPFGRYSLNSDPSSLSVAAAIAVHQWETEQDEKLYIPVDWKILNDNEERLMADAQEIASVYDHGKRKFSIAFGGYKQVVDCVSREEAKLFCEHYLGIVRKVVK